jgi:hypothetical protein
MLISALNPRPIDLLQRLLIPPGLAAVVHRLEQRRHLGERVGQRLGAVAQMLVQPPLPRPPRLRFFRLQPLPEMLPHQRMRVELVWCVMALRCEQSKVTQLVEQAQPVAVRQPAQLLG